MQIALRFLQARHVNTVTLITRFGARPSSRKLALEFNNPAFAAISTSAPAVTLRPYQQDCVDEVLAALKRGDRRFGVSLPTGSGKTTIFAALIPKLPRVGTNGSQVLVLVGTVELARQAANRICEMHPHMSVEIEQGAANNASGLADCTVATYQTLLSRGRISKFRPELFKGIFVDEAHHSSSRAYLTVLSHFDQSIKVPQVEHAQEETDEILESETCLDSSTELQETRQSPDIPDSSTLVDPLFPIIGFSATFARHDGLALTSVYDHLVYHKDFISMIVEGWLSPVSFTTVHVNFDLADVTVNNATQDFVLRSLSAVINTPTVNRLVVESWKARTTDRRSTLVFAVDVQHVEDLTAEFRAQGVDARSLTGRTPSRERITLLEDFKALKYPVLVNCAILTEGADVPSIDCVLLARPTLSQNLFSQMIGRGLRKFPGKSDCLVLDFVGNSSKSKLICVPSLFGLDPATTVNEATVDQMIQMQAQNASLGLSGNIDQDDVRYKTLRTSDLLKVEDKPIYHISTSAWVHAGDDIYILDCGKAGYIRVFKAENGWLSLFFKRNTFSKAGVNRGAPVYQEEPDSQFDRCIRICDTAAGRYLQHAGMRPTYLLKSAPWRQQPATDVQKKALRKMLGNDVSGLLSFAFGSSTFFAKDKTSIDTLTRGQANSLFTLSRHGAKGRILKAEKHDAQISKLTQKRDRKRAMNPTLRASVH